MVTLKHREKVTAWFKFRQKLICKYIHEKL
jgi:hypothetical protein